MLLDPDNLLPLETKAKYKGRHPHNTRNQLLELQHKFDELEALGGLYTSAQKMLM